MTPLTVKAFTIHGAEALDSIDVYLEDFNPGVGRITISCYGSVWTTFFNAMGETHNIETFMRTVSVDYLIGRLGSAAHLKQGKQYQGYLKRVVTAVKNAMAGSIPV